MGKVVSLCLDCSRDGHGCNDRNDGEPLVHCTLYVSKANVPRPCPACVDKPPAGFTCRMCGAVGPVVISESEGGWSQPREEFKVGCDCAALKALLRAWVAAADACDRAGFVKPHEDWELERRVTAARDAVLEAARALRGEHL